MRVLAVDFGSKRIGIAVGEAEFSVASPRPILEASGKLETDAAKIAELARREEANLVVVGVPENDDDPRMAKVCRMLAERIAKLGWTVETIDESFTSIAAESALMESDLTAAGRKKRRDSEAACQILTRWMHASRS